MSQHRQPPPPPPHTKLVLLAEMMLYTAELYSHYHLTGGRIYILVTPVEVQYTLTELYYFTASMRCTHKGNQGGTVGVI